PVIFMPAYVFSLLKILRHSHVCLSQSLVVPSSLALATILPAHPKATDQTLERLAERLSQMIEWRHESIFTGSERASASRSRRRQTARANYRAVPYFTSDHQALPQAETRNRNGATPPHSRTHAEERSGAASTRRRIAARASGCET